MRISFAATLFATALGVAVPSAQADPGLRFGSNGIAQPASVRPATTASYYNYYAQDTAPSPSDAPAAPSIQPGPPAVPQAVPATGGYGACDSGCGTACTSGCNSCCGLGGGLFRDCCHGPQWHLFPQDHCSGITLGGWLAAGYYANEYGLEGDDANGPIAFRGLAEELALHQGWFYAEREANGACGWDWGFRVDYVFGTDGPNTQAFGQNSGYDTDWDTGSRYGSALPQLYGEVAYGDLSVKFGHFFSILGFEVVPAPDNFFTSYSYTFNYGEPFTHTGALAEYAYSDDVTLYGGYVFGWDTGFDDGGDGAMLLSGVRLALTENVEMTYASTYGNFNDELSAGDVYLHSLVFDVTLTERANYVLQSDYAVNYDRADDTAYWYGINQYLFYTLNDCWSAGVRAEWFDDEDGTRGLIAGDYYAVTTGLNWKPTANLIVRPEARYDWFEGNAAGGPAPFDNGTEDEQLSAGFDVIYLF